MTCRILVALGLIQVGAVQGQDTTTAQGEYRPLRLESADEIENQRIDGQDVMRGRGNVRFSQDTLTASGDQAAFFRDLQLAILVGRVVLNDRHRTIFSEKARYYARDKRAVCEGRVLFIDEDLTLAADSLVYYQSIEQLMAVGHVVVFDSSEAMTMHGDEGFYDVRRKYARVTGNPRIVQYDSTSYKGQNTARLSRGYETRRIRDSVGLPIRYSASDQLTIRGKMVESYTDSSQIYVRDSVMFTREKLETRSGLAVFHTKKELLRLEQNPTSNYDHSTMSGEKMFVQFRDKEIDSMWVQGNATATSPADTVSGRMNRLTGREITLFVEDRELTRMVAVGNAYNLYYLEGEEGVNEISGPRMILFFAEQGRLKNFRVEGGAEGTYYPQSMSTRVPVHE